MTDLNDDDVVLSSSTQAALAEFLAEQQDKQSKVQYSPENEEDISIDSFPEDWQVHTNPFFIDQAKKSQLSQFWYDDKTAETLANELLYETTDDTIIAIISAPSVYAKLKVLALSKYFHLSTEEENLSTPQDIPL